MHTIPPALQDRMEVIRLSGYTEVEKMEIAKRFLVKKQMDNTGLDPKNIEFTDAGLHRWFNTIHGNQACETSNERSATSAGRSRERW